ncbi:MAG: tail fiber domain-containing protein [Meiothermus sp.]|nr:tail fiber domain-containing protein [Meiothermus sp.]
MGRNHTNYFVAGAVLAAGGLFGLAVSELAVFKAGDPIRSSEVNGNFAILKGAVEALEAPIGLSRLEIQGTGVNGKTLKFLDGALAWEDDQIGTGSGGGDISAVGAGTGLEGGGTSGDVTLQIAGAFRLPQSCSGGQVPKWNGSLWACASDDVGTGGGGSGDITRVTAGSGLSGGGDSGDVTLSLADNGVTTARLANGAVTTAKLADGAVTGAKLASSLTMGGLSVVNSATTGFSFALRGQAGGTAGLNLSTPNGLLGESAGGVGVLGGSSSGIGVDGRSASLIGVRGQGGGGAGLSISTAVGVLGESPGGIGVIGGSQSGIGVLGRSSTRGIVGTQGSLTLPCAGNFGVGGCAESATGVYGTSSSFRGVEGVSSTGIGVLGNSNARGVVGTLGGTSCRGDLTYAMGGCASGTGFSAVFVGGSGGSGVCSFNGSAGWNCTSDRNKKENFRPVDARAILEALAKLPVTRWNMKGDANKTPHIGPTAQDFYAAFGLGEDDKTINAADAQGVALAAIKGLYQENQALKAQNAELARRMGELEAQMAGIQAMQAKLANLEARLGGR